MYGKESRYVPGSMRAVAELPSGLNCSSFVIWSVYSWPTICIHINILLVRSPRCDRSSIMVRNFSVEIRAVAKTKRTSKSYSGCNTPHYLCIYFERLTFQYQSPLFYCVALYIRI